MCRFGLSDAVNACTTDVVIIKNPWLVSRGFIVNILFCSVLWLFCYFIVLLNGLFLWCQNEYTQ